MSECVKSNPSKCKAAFKSLKTESVPWNYTVSQTFNGSLLMCLFHVWETFRFSWWQRKRFTDTCPQCHSSRTQDLRVFDWPECLFYFTFYEKAIQEITKSILTSLLLCEVPWALSKLMCGLCCLTGTREMIALVCHKQYRLPGLSKCNVSDHKVLCKILPQISCDSLIERFAPSLLVQSCDAV